MPPGDAPLIPDPPPPRPAAREEAISAAMRRFDGVEEIAPARSRPPRAAGSWTRKPQFAMAMSLGLVVIIGGPLTWLAIRNGALNPPPVQSQPPRAAVQAKAPSSPAPASPAAEAAQTTEAARIANSPSSAAPSPTPIAQDAKKDVAPPAPALAEQEVAAAVPAMAPPPPPPPAPAPPPVAEKSAEGMVANDIAITGSRIPQPNLTSASPVTVVSRSAERDEADVINSLPKMQKPSAPAWVLSDPAYAAFLTQLQGAVRTGNREGVIRLVRLPLRVNFSGKGQTYRTTASVSADYDKIFTSRVRQAVLTQRFDQLFGRDQGVMIGNGQVWFDHVGSVQGPVRITAINP